MKYCLLVVVLIIAFACADQNINPQNGKDVLKHLQGNNYNIYAIFFAAPEPTPESAKVTNKDVADGLRSILADNPDIYYAKVDHADERFKELFDATGIFEAPAILLMVHGRGLWISGGTSNLIVQRLKEFLPDFKQASAHHKHPYN